MILRMNCIFSLYDQERLQLFAKCEQVNESFQFLTDIDK